MCWGGRGSEGRGAGEGGRRGGRGDAGIGGTRGSGDAGAWRSPGGEEEELGRPKAPPLRLPIAGGYSSEGRGDLKLRAPRRSRASVRLGGCWRAAPSQARFNSDAEGVVNALLLTACPCSDELQMHTECFSSEKCRPPRRRRLCR